MSVYFTTTQMVIYETQLIMGNRHLRLREDEVVYAVSQLYTFTLRIFVNIIK